MTLTNVSLSHTQTAVRSGFMAIGSVTFNLTASVAEAEESAVASAIPTPAIRIIKQAWQALVAWFHQPQLNIAASLDYYNQDYRSRYVTLSLPRLAQNTVSES